MHIIQMSEYKNRDVVKTLETMLALAREGRIHGVAWVAKFGIGDHRAGYAGVYRTHPAKALMATFQLERELRRDMK